MTNKLLTFTIGALGDSITTAFNAAASANNPSHSWVTGDAGVVSHRVRLMKAFPSLQVIPHNVAVAGARGDSLAGQVTSLLVRPPPPDYVSILIGANDLHAWLMSGEYGAALTRFQLDVQEAIQRLIVANPRVLVVLSGIPNQSRVLALALCNSGGPAARLLAELPADLLAKLKHGYRERWERANAALAAVASKFPANVRFVAKTPRVQFDSEHLSSIDFYHPSVAGQRLIAEVTWEQGWFP